MDKRLEIKILNSKLNATHGKAVEHLEGLLTDEEYAPIRAQRQEWRDRINALEKDLANKE